MARSPVGLVLIVAGGGLILAGLLVWSGALSWFGRLPGDIRIERPNAKVYVPITSMLLISIVLSLVTALVRRWR
jgi:membrane protein implicated in regulation of membrane protease activity